MKKLMIMAAVALTVAACGGKKDSGLEVSWIKDNQGERLMPVSLFPDAPQSLIDSLGGAGRPSFIGRYLPGVHR